LGLGKLRGRGLGLRGALLLRFGGQHRLDHGFRHAGGFQCDERTRRQIVCGGIGANHGDDRRVAELRRAHLLDVGVADSARRASGVGSQRLLDAGRGFGRVDGIDSFGGLGGVVSLAGTNGLERRFRLGQRQLLSMLRQRQFF
jgi:hypothetical protein